MKEGLGGGKQGRQERKEEVVRMSRSELLLCTYVNIKTPLATNMCVCLV